ncbi:S-layer homology domain-containing protein [Patescibacteria group bacterium]|nr:S-layer homology domain-containing protein [Patescibacteria group bacterium]
MYKQKHLFLAFIIGAIVSLIVVIALPLIQDSLNGRYSTQAGPSPVCGNSIPELGEECDDGNTTDGDGCSSTCLIEAVCGDDVVAADRGEYCDDGGICSGDGTTLCMADSETDSCSKGPGGTCEPQDGDGCSSTCEIEPVGCYFTFDELTMILKDGATDAGCAGVCTNPDALGGFGYIGGYAANNTSCVCVGQGSETCEGLEGVCLTLEGDPEFNNAVCGYLTCGNEIVDESILPDSPFVEIEMCDDGNLVDGDGCSARCQTEVCGNNVINIGEECDDGNTDSGDGCNATCVKEINGCFVYLEGQTIPQASCTGWCGGYGGVGTILNNGWCLCEGGDNPTCDTFCTNFDSPWVCNYLQCGNGVVEGGEQCDGAGDFTTCDKNCQRVPVCGDGYMDSPEQCDDSNTTAGDGCSATCQVDGTVFTHAAGDPIEQCDPIEPGVICLWRGIVYFKPTVVNNTVGNDSPFSDKTDTGAIEWFKGKCSTNPTKANALFGDLMFDFLAYTEEIPALNWFVSLFVNDAYAKPVPWSAIIPGNYTCLHAKASNKYYDLYWTGYNDEDDGFSYVRNQYVPVCGNSTKEIGETCDDGNLLSGDGCSKQCVKEGAKFFSYAGGGTFANGDVLVDKSVTIWRGTTNQVFNVDDGADYNMATASSTIEWAAGTCASPTSAYNDGIAATLQSGSVTPGTSICLHLKNYDIYYDMIWASWEEDGVGDGGFSYYRWLYDTQAPNLASIIANYSTGQISLDISKTPSDNGGGKLTRCVAKYSSSQITTEDDWNNATKIYDKVNPLDNCFQNNQVSFYAPGTNTYYYAIRVYDGSGNKSDISGTTSGVVIPNPPTVTGLSPTTDANNQAVTLTVTGTNFDDGEATTVRLIGANNFFNIKNATVNSNTELQIDVPAGIAPGPYKVIIVNTYGISAVSSNAIYTATAANNPLPVVYKMYPSVGPAGSDVDITIGGANFTDATALYASNNKTPVAIAGFSVDPSGNTITATIPSGALAAGTSYSFIVDTPNGSNAYAPPYYTPYSKVSIAPTDSSGSTEIGQGQTADFSDFTGEANTELKQDLVLRNNSNQVSNNIIVTSLVANIPAGTKITDSVGTRFTGRINPPRIVDKDEVIPTGAQAKLGKNSIIIEMGDPTEKINFDTDFVVTVELVADIQPVIWYYNRSEDTFELAGKEGFNEGEHYYPGGIALSSITVDGETVWTIGFLTDHMSAYVAGVTPTITDISPALGLAGASVTITGTNFHSSATLTVGGEAAVAIVDDTETISATIPATLTEGAHDVIVINPDLSSDPYSFTVTVPGAEEEEVATTTTTGTGGGGLGGGSSVFSTRQQLVGTVDSTTSKETSTVSTATTTTTVAQPLQVSSTELVDGMKRATLTESSAVLTIRPNVYSNVYMKIPASTTVEGTSAWDGIINPPLIRSAKYYVSLLGDEIEGADNLLLRTNIAAVVEAGSKLSTLQFSNPLSMTVPVPLNNGTTVNVYTRISGEKSWRFVDSAEVINGKVTFETSTLSYYAISRVEDAVTLHSAASPIERVVAQVVIAFSDIVNHWAESYINRLYGENIITGKAEGLFMPNDPITRAELIKIALNTFQYGVPTSVTSKPFEDVDVNAWYAPYAQVAKSNGIFTGFPDGMHPNEYVTRAEALKTLLVASRLSIYPSTDKVFTDTNPYAWYMKYIRYAYENDIMAGYADGSFGPGNNITRAEAAKVTVEIIDRVLGK